MIYALFITIGIALGLAARRLAPEPAPPHAAAIRLIAVLGAIAGAVLFQAPADFFGWSAGVAGEPVVLRSLGGRTIVGGLLGGWIAVEAGKWGLGVKQATGDGFALPAAVALACGRLGCLFTGCCAGRAATDDAWWSALAMPGKDGVPRFPAQLAEVAFHALAAAALYVGWRRRWIPDRRFAAYVALYAVFRFALEEARDNPPVAAGLSYYQWLTMPLLTLAASTLALRWWRANATRSRGAKG